ncbi:MAG TPA: protein phosphatase CheZ [Casimicrobiaceae bacterium]
MTAATGEEDLEALFERLAEEHARAAAAQLAQSVNGDAADAAPSKTPEAIAAEAASVYQRIGQLTRTLHDALRGLGYDRKLAQAAQTLPDARDRLAYIADLTGSAAERVLSSVERAQSVQQSLRDDAAALGDRWERLYTGALSVDEFKALAGDTRGFLRAAAERSGTTQSELTEIMMAQDFHDLTGQVIKRVGDIATTLEASLVALLLETRPADGSSGDGVLTGPVIDTARPDVVTSQAQVDELLAALGF